MSDFQYNSDETFELNLQYNSLFEQELEENQYTNDNPIYCVEFSYIIDCDNDLPYGDENTIKAYRFYNIVVLAELDPDFFIVFDKYEDVEEDEDFIYYIDFYTQSYRRQLTY